MTKFTFCLVIDVRHRAGITSPTQCRAFAAAPMPCRLKCANSRSAGEACVRREASVTRMAAAANHRHEIAKPSRSSAFRANVKSYSASVATVIMPNVGAPSLKFALGAIGYCMARGNSAFEAHGVSASTRANGNFGPRRGNKLREKRARKHQ